MTARRKQSDYMRQHPKDERAYGERNEDPYQSRGKYPEPSTCTGCGAVYEQGRWQWGAARPDAHKHLCPACQRIHDRAPAGIVTISGEFFIDHQQEIVGLIHNIEAKEKSGHPLQRIMSLKQGDGSITLELTDFHITSAIIHALQDAYQGNAEEQYVDKDGVMRGSWSR
jgi:hypothetical protein